MAALPQLITVEEFRQLPESELAYELHFGEVVAMTRPKHRHVNLQLRLSDLLTPRLRSFGRVATEVPYRPFPEFDLRVADVAAVSQARWDAIDPDDNLRGAPDLVIEVKSPSNTARQLRELVSICLGNGASEVWIVDTDKKSVTVFRQDGIPAVFIAGDVLSLAAFGGSELPVAEIFA
ncbi:MAG TPA: Uma2 family endonuclease [Bryobacteraceae bacterium]|jgi:Uma2 family endonuclease|nr:Uma2 family endonuclease [Bryobacteraceae bacterium]